MISFILGILIGALGMWLFLNDRLKILNKLPRGQDSDEDNK
jgi:predicted RNA-binding protein with PUA domain